MSTRTQIEKEMYEFLDDMDPSGKNTERLRKFFKTMDDKQFYKYMVDFLSDDNKYIQVGYEAFDNPVSMEFIDKSSRKYDIPLY